MATGQPSSGRLLPTPSLAPAGARPDRSTYALVGLLLGLDLVAIPALVCAAAFPDSGVWAWAGLGLQTLAMVVCLLILVRAVRAERQVAARFDRLDWQAVHGHVRYAFDHIGRRVQAGRSDIKVRTGRTDAEAGDLVFMYCVFTTDSVDADDAVCLGVSFHPADDGRTAECLIDLSGESSGNVWVELFAGLIPASAAELIRVVQVHLSATEDVARQIDGRIDALAVEANVGGRE